MKRGNERIVIERRGATEGVVVGQNNRHGVCQTRRRIGMGKWS
jgi:hypothetical protein